MDNTTLVAIVSIGMAGLTMTFGSIAPAIGESRAIISALTSIAQQPDASSTLSRTLFIGLAMIESIAIYCFVIAIILIFANPFWSHFATQATK